MSAISVKGSPVASTVKVKRVRNKKPKLRYETIGMNTYVVSPDGHLIRIDLL